MLDHGINSAALSDNDRFTKLDGYLFTKYAEFMNLLSYHYASILMGS